MFRFHYLFLVRFHLKKSGRFLVNFIGLLTGLTASLLLGSYVWQALHVNANLSDADQIYFIEARYKNDEKIFPFLTPSPLAKAIVDEYPTFYKNYYRFWDRMVVLSHDDKRFEEQTLIGDSTFISMFGFKVLYGDGRQALQSPNKVIVTKTIAAKYFGKENAVGELLILNTESGGNKPFAIGAVIDDPGENSVTDFMDINAQVFLSIENSKDFVLPDATEWHRASTIVSFVKLSENVNLHDAEVAIDKTLQKYLPENFREVLDRCELVPLKSMYLTSDNGTVKTKVIALSLVVGFILIVSILNFINLLLLGALQRVKEIGIRKIYGADRPQIQLLCLLDAFLLTLFPSIVSIILYEAFHPALGASLGLNLGSITELDPAFWMIAATLFLFMNIVASIYPAIVLGTIKIPTALQGLAELNRRTSLSHYLLFLEFTLSIGLFCFALTSSQQNDFLLNGDLGFDSNNIVTASAPRIWSAEGVNRMQTAIDEFMRLPSVEAATLSWEVPDGNYGSTVELYKDGQDQAQAIAVPMFMADEKYDNTFGLTLIDGVFFQNEGEQWQPQKVVINESASKALGLKLGDRVKLKGKPFVFVVAGIVKDFRYTSLHKTSGPLMFINTRLTQTYRFISIKLRRNVDASTIDMLDKKWSSMFPETPFTYFVLDDKLSSVYHSELALERMVKLATILFSVTSIVSIFSLMVNTMTRKRKELAIRRTMGAGNLKLLINVSGRFLLILGLAFAAAAPLSIYFIREWLQTFAYKIKLSVFPILLACLIFGLIIFTVIVVLIFRISKQELVKNLRIN